MKRCRATFAIVAIVAMMSAACSAPRAGGADTSTAAAAAPASATDSATVARLERDARALAKVDGCAQSADCRTAPVGSRPCGGPRDYVVYCPKTTDSVALYRALDTLARAEQALNQRIGAMGTCEFREPPKVESVGGSCRAVP